METGGCAYRVRDNVSTNLEAVEAMERVFPDLGLIFVESGGDNLAASFSPEPVLASIYVIDVAGGDKIPRKGGPASPARSYSSSTRPTWHRSSARTPTSWTGTRACCAAKPRRSSPPARRRYGGRRRVGARCGRAPRLDTSDLHREAGPSPRSPALDVCCVV